MIGGRINDSQSYIFLKAKGISGINPIIEIYIEPRNKAKTVGHTTGDYGFGLHLLLNNEEEFRARVSYKWKDWDGNEHSLEPESIIIKPLDLPLIQPDEEIKELLSGSYRIDIY